MAAQVARLMGIDLVDLELFANVVDAGSITQGARLAHLALPSASARIRHMEKTLRTPLLERGRRGVTPTAAGHLLLRHARTVLHQIDHLRGDLTHYAESLVATVSVLANSAAITTFLPSELVSFLVTHPDINIDIEEHSSRQIVRAVTEGRADIGIVADTVDTAALHTATLRTDTLVLVTSVENPLAERERISLDESLSQPFIGLAEGRTVEQHHQGAAEPSGQRLNYRIRLPSIESVCQAVSADVGVSVLPVAAALRWHDTYPVATVPLTDPWAQRKLLLCTNHPTTLSTPARSLLDHLNEHREAP